MATVGIMGIWRQQLKRHSLKRANAVLRAASGYIGKTEGSDAAEAAIDNLLVQYEMLQKQIKAQETLMQGYNNKGIDPVLEHD